MNAQDMMLLGLDDDDDYDDDDDDDDDIDLLGARRVMSLRRGKRRSGARRAVRRALKQPFPGTPASGPKQYPLGFPIVSFTDVTSTSLQAQTNPQRPFKGYRLVTSIARTGAGATGLVSISTLFVGQDSQLVSSNPIGADVFQPGAFSVELALTDAGPGILITITYTISVLPGNGEQVDVGTTLIGMTLA